MKTKIGYVRGETLYKVDSAQEINMNDSEAMFLYYNQVIRRGEIVGRINREADRISWYDQPQRFNKQKIVADEMKNIKEPVKQIEAKSDAMVDQVLAMEIDLDSFAIGTEKLKEYTF